MSSTGNEQNERYEKTSLVVADCGSDSWCVGLICFKLGGSEDKIFVLSKVRHNISIF